MVKEINTELEFEKAVKESGDIPVVVDFWAPWCGPCKMLGPVLQEIGSDLEGKAQVVKINVDNHPGLASKFNVMSIPTVIIFKNGNVVENMVGFRPKPALTSVIEKHL